MLVLGVGGASPSQTPTVPGGPKRGRVQKATLLVPPQDLHVGEEVAQMSRPHGIGGPSWGGGGGGS